MGRKIDAGSALSERHRQKKEMNSLETLLNTAVEEKGWRISPRASLEDRLVRYLQLTWNERGRDLSEEDARGAAQLMILKHNGDDSRTESNNSSNAWVGRTRRSSSTEANNNVNTNVWSGRTRSSSRPNSNDTTPTNRNVSATRDGNVRVTFSSSGTHPMVRRSHVSSSR